MNEAENTMRALKDEPLLATSFLCRLAGTTGPSMVSQKHVKKVCGTLTTKLDIAATVMC